MRRCYVMASVNTDFAIRIPLGDSVTVCFAYTVAHILPFHFLTSFPRKGNRQRTACLSLQNTNTFFHPINYEKSAKNFYLRTFCLLFMNLSRGEIA